jgi:hypothetical protein
MGPQMRGRDRRNGDMATEDTDTCSTGRIDNTTMQLSFEGRISAYSVSLGIEAWGEVKIPGDEFV